MASVTPATGEVGFAPDLSGCTIRSTPFVFRPGEPPCVERVGSVRIIRGHGEWRGFALRLAHDMHDQDTGENGLCELALTTADGRSITVAIVDEPDAVALWRDCCRVSGLRLMLETSDGVVTEPYPQIGRLALGEVRIRRRYGYLNGRRPRFLARRKTGRISDRPVVLSGERLTD